MSDVVIKAEGLGKKYLIGHLAERERYTALRDVMVRNVKGVLSKTRQVLSGQQLLAGDEFEEFWALRDIEFEIKRGDRVGIIGRNGAGKSTLLKILSRITEPSAGRVEIHGRVASLLEVGTGFHPELTGRENIYLNGAILGMTRVEIKKKFDEIVDFSGVEKFLDTPVKRYSSGMYVRLAFAVAAHLEPEILVVDEVLAVGDAEFQKKCLGKMEEVSKNDGRTVLFVSHNLSLMESLCETGIYLNKGKIKNIGGIEEVISSYTSISKVNPKRIGVPFFEELIVEEISATPNALQSGATALFNIKITSISFCKILSIVLFIQNESGVRITALDLRKVVMKDLRPRETMTTTVSVESFNLIEGTYSIGLFIHTNKNMGNVVDILDFSVHPAAEKDNIIPYEAKYRGLMALDFECISKIS